ncbi:hypothetical protein J1N10_20685 [Carboxylicivirga sp. A043]|uniref:ABC-three component system middle component 1 n=1 Tax=Carboxylicivirga litoralis TaxID=2816963 RepID=UPI0021CB644A|nr:ABC-three component system middle component 1 [Carboxylicivirga sp. A043]MCU4158401.1 hypothetical protein [Carboxylicivirga sp. A043]
MKQETSYKEIDNSNLFENIEEAFPINYLSIGEICWGGNILVAIVEFKDFETMTTQWKNFNSFISAELLTLKKDEFSKWNFYVFYLSKEANKELKYEIENNKFSSRKIVLEDYPSELDNDNILNIVRNHITNEDILKIVESPEKSSIIRNSLIDNAINMFESPSKKSDYAEYSKSILKQIEKSLRDEI